MESLDLYTFSGRGYGVSFFDQLVSRVSQLLYHLDFYVPADKVSLKQKYINRVMERYIPLYLSNYHKTRYSIDTLSTGKSVSSVTAGDDNGLMDSPWPMKCHDQRHTGCSPYSTASNNGVLLWSFKTGAPIDAGIVISSDGTIYFGCHNNYLYALYPNGTLKWKYKTGGWIWCSPAIGSDGTIYVGSWDCKLYAVNPDGSLKWRFPAGQVITSSPVIDNDDIIYFGVMGPGYKGRVYALYPNGTVKWYYDTGDWITSDPALGEDGTLYIGSCDNYLYTINPNGTLKWRYKTGDYIKGPPSIDKDGTIYFNSFDDYLYALYPNGTLKWKCKVGYGSETNPSIGPDGTIYVGGKYLYAIYPNGSLKWKFNLGYDRHIAQSSPAISSDGIIYVGTNIHETDGGEIIAINPDGTERWRRMIANTFVDSSPCIDQNGIIYIGSTSSDQFTGYSFGVLYAFGEGTLTPPDPPVIEGPGEGKTDEWYWFNFTGYSCVDIGVDGIGVSYFVDWGDGSSTGWTHSFNSGEKISLDHHYTEKGTYVIKAKVRDVFYGLESGWSYHTINITKKKNNPLEILLLNLCVFNRLKIHLEELMGGGGTTYPTTQHILPIHFYPNTHQKQKILYIISQGLI